MGFAFEARDFDVHEVRYFPAFFTDDIEVLVTHEIIIGCRVIGTLEFSDKSFL